MLFLPIHLRKYRITFSHSPVYISVAAHIYRQPPLIINKRKGENKTLQRKKQKNNGMGYKNDGGIPLNALSLPSVGKNLPGGSPEERKKHDPLGLPDRADIVSVSSCRKHVENSFQNRWEKLHRRLQPPFRMLLH